MNRGKRMLKNLAGLVVVAAALLGAAPAPAADDVKTHRIAIQVDQNDPALMNLVLNNVSNLLEYYHAKGEQAQIEVVAYGPGLNMLREDKSPVKDRLRRVKEGSFPSSVSFSACGNTKRNMEKAEGHPIDIVAQATIVPAGVVRLTELQEQGWAYIRP
jgi:intracellular sulfur oxidation DsrE/DsrF family protein